jgi:hypothetical protein
MPAPADVRLGNEPGAYRFDGFDGHRGPVGGDLGYDAADLVAVKPHPDYGVGVARPRLAPHPLPGLVAAVGQQLGVSGDLSPRQRPELRTQVAEVMAGPAMENNTATLKLVRGASLLRTQIKTRNALGETRWSVLLDL